MISLPANFWSVYAQSAKFNPELCLPATCRSVTYEELLAQADSKIAKNLTPETFQSQWVVCQEAVGALSRALSASSPDVAVTITDDQSALFFDDNMPMSNIYWGDSIKLIPHTARPNASPKAQELN